MNNPLKVEKPKLTNPLKTQKTLKESGNLPYLRARKKLRKDILRGW